MRKIDNINSLKKSDFLSIFGNVFEKTESVALETFNLKPYYTSKIGPVFIFPKKNFITKKKLPIYHIHSNKFIEIQKFNH